MDDFLADLERNITNLGSSKYWKKQIGDVVLWLSPITLHGQERVNEILANSENLGMNVINETKRVTLSFSIVGINDIDLREYRNNQPIFPSIGKDGKPTKVALDKYIYNKMQAWSSQFIDDVFSVMADLIQTEQKENLKNIKFENAKDPEEELAELESRVAELRENLGKPQLVEAKKVEEKEPEEAPVINQLPSRDVVEVDFDPFAKVTKQAPASVPGQSQPQVPIPQPQAPVPQTPIERIVKDPNGNPINAFTSSPSVPNEVVEAPSIQVKSPPPVIDPVVVNRNPRFSPPTRG